MTADPPPDRVRLLYHFCRLHLPAVPLTEASAAAHLRRTYDLFAGKNPAPVAWGKYLDELYALDWAVAVGCLEGEDAAWEQLFLTKTGRSDCLLIDALRARAHRLYPRDDERQESAVTEFWSQLLVPEGERGKPVLARYDGQRPLAPWLIRVFQNLHLSKLRQSTHTTALPDDDIALPLPTPETADARWHDVFRTAARDWLADLPDAERLLLGLRWRYKLSQREVSHVLGVHEGTISRQTDKLRDGAWKAIGDRMTAAGWDGDDLDALIASEMAGVLVDDPRLSADQLSSLLTKRTGKEAPALPSVED